MRQTTLGFIENRGLFSNHFLENQLLTLDEWKELKDIEEIFSKIKALYQSQESLFQNADEAQLRAIFIDHVLKDLGHYHTFGGKIEGTAKRPDYGLFPDENSLKDAIKHQDTEDFYKKAISLCEAKAWEIKLDERDPKNIEPDKRTPNRQIDDYLRCSEKKWGILTNGRFWRLYYRENSYRNYFYQIDLAEIIKKDDVNAFKYFYLFFRKDAFDVDVNNVCFLDRVYQGSVDYAKDIGENLEENIYKAMKILAEGFINWGESNLTKTEENLKVIQENTMKFLYRFLFIFFAEAKGLLDISQKTPASKEYTGNYSLDSLKKKIKNRIESREDIPAYLDSYWNQLRTLFSFIDKGTEASNISREKLYIPSYNGGLFDTEKNKFLSEKKIGDHYLAKAINLLASTEGKKPEEKGFVDYASLDIRHLGAIYEGLLEYKLKTATEPMVAVKEKGKEKWIPESEFKGKNYVDRVDKDELYLATDKGERKATGSYYTPEYIVKYIVENTLKPVVKEKIKNAIEKKEKYSDAILSIKVLDPAMGSGHFLVEVVDFLGHNLSEAINKDIERGLLEEGSYSDDWLRREVVSHCVYGVDLNPMAVELAKVSLWLKTISKDKPLSFLDHRLKCGNSLIGDKLKNLPWWVGQEPDKLRQKDQQPLFEIPTPFIDKLLNAVGKIEDLSDDTLDNIRRKEKIFADFHNSLEYEYIKVMSDVRTSIYFGTIISPNNPKQVYMNFMGKALECTEKEWEERRSWGFVKRANSIANEKSFFHWELEFPEIFYEIGKEKDNPGFDAVVGNPPWGESVIQEHKDILSVLFNVRPKNLNAFDVFTRLAIRVKKSNVGFLIPRNSCRSNDYINLREYLLKTSTVKDIFDWKLFPDVVQECISIILTSKTYDDMFVKINGEEFQTQKDLKESVDFIFNIFSNKKEIKVKNKIGQYTGRLDEYVKIKRGEEISRAAKVIRCPKCTFWRVASKQEEVKCPHCASIFKVGEAIEDTLLCDRDKKGARKIVDGEDIKRYSMDEGVFICFDKKGITSKLEDGIYEAGKILMQKISTNIVATYDNKNTCYTQNVYGLRMEKSAKISPFLITALLNSKTLNFFQEHTFNIGAKWTTAISIENIRYKLPICRISFTTSKEEREKLISDIKQKYKDEKLDEILKAVEECLPKDKEGNFIPEKEKSDVVVHDILAFLAEQMLDMNKVKQEEIKGFLSWLEREIGVKIDELSNKTAIKEYYSGTFEKMLEVLKKNKKKISRNLSNRQFQDNLKKEFDKSVTKLKPLMAKIETTDGLIDQIVYKLYGLTDDEIRIVEESFKGKPVNTEEELSSNEGE